MIVEVWFGYLFFIYKYADISQYLAKKPNTPEIVTRTRTSWPSCWHQHQGFRQTNRSSSRCSGDCLWQYQEGWLQRYSQAAPKAASKCVCCCQNFFHLWVSPSPPIRHILVSMTLSRCRQVTPPLEALVIHDTRESEVLLMHNLHDARVS